MLAKNIGIHEKIIHPIVTEIILSIKVDAFLLGNKVRRSKSSFICIFIESERTLGLNFVSESRNKRNSPFAFSLS